MVTVAGVVTRSVAANRVEAFSPSLFSPTLTTAFKCGEKFGLVFEILIYDFMP